MRPPNLCPSIVNLVHASSVNWTFCALLFTGAQTALLQVGSWKARVTEHMSQGRKGNCNTEPPLQKPPRGPCLLITYFLSQQFETKRA